MNQLEFIHGRDNAHTGPRRGGNLPGRDRDPKEIPMVDRTENPLAGPIGGAIECRPSRAAMVGAVLHWLIVAAVAAGVIVTAVR